MSLAPGDAVAYHERDWRGVLVTVEQGEVDLEMSCGRHFYFEEGDMLWLQNLPLVAIRNRRSEPTVLVATSRRVAS